MSELSKRMRNLRRSATPGTMSTLHLGVSASRAAGKGKTPILTIGGQTAVVTDHQGGHRPSADVEFAAACFNEIEALCDAADRAPKLGENIIGDPELNELRRAQEALVKIRQLSADARSSDFYQRKYLLDQIDAICGPKP